MIFIFSLFHLKKLTIFQQRVIQHSSFSGLTFNCWQRGRIKFKWKTLKFLEVRFSITVLFFFFLLVKEMSSQRSGQYLSTSLEALVIFWSLPWKTQTDRDVTLCEFRQRVSTCQLQGLMMSSSEAVRKKCYKNLATLFV